PSREHLVEGATVDVLEDDEWLPVGVPAVDLGDDVRMRELRDRPGLAPEPLDVLRVVEMVLVEDLQSDVTLQERVVRLVDARHSAAAHELLELIAVADQSPNSHHRGVPPLTLAKRRGRLPTRRPKPRALPRARRPTGRPGRGPGCNWSRCRP